jgi:hypothetical protein
VCAALHFIFRAVFHCDCSFGFYYPSNLKHVNDRDLNAKPR